MENELKCCICFEYLFIPISCDTCGHSVCREHYPSLSMCPVCRSQDSVTDRENRSLSRILDLHIALSPEKSLIRRQSRRIEDRLERSPYASFLRFSKDVIYNVNASNIYAERRHNNALEKFRFINQIMERNHNDTIERIKSLEYNSGVEKKMFATVVIFSIWLGILFKYDATMTQYFHLS